MYIYTQLSTSEVAQELINDKSNGFSREGCYALAEYLENLANDLNEPIELDIVAIRCEYSEYENMDAFRVDYGDEYETIEDVEYRTTVIRIENSEAFIIQQF